MSKKALSLDLKKKNHKYYVHYKWYGKSVINTPRDVVPLETHCLYDSESVCKFPENIHFTNIGIQCNCRKAQQFIRTDESNWFQACQKCNKHRDDEELNYEGGSNEYSKMWEM